MEETHYYPFGLTMKGISSKAAGVLQNKEQTFQEQRFDDDLGLTGYHLSGELMTRKQVDLYKLILFPMIIGISRLTIFQKTG